MKKQQNLNAMHAQLMQEYRQASEITGLMAVRINQHVAEFKALVGKIDCNSLMGGNSAGKN